MPKLTRSSFLHACRFPFALKMAANDDGLEGTDTTDNKDNSAFLPKDEGSIDCSQTKHENLFFYPFGIQSRISDF